MSVCLLYVGVSLPTPPLFCLPNSSVSFLQPALTISEWAPLLGGEGDQIQTPSPAPALREEPGLRQGLPCVLEAVD